MNALSRRLHPRRLRRTLGAASCVKERRRFITSELRDVPTVESYRLRKSGLAAAVRHPLLDAWVLEEVFRFGAYDPPAPIRRAMAELRQTPRVLDLGGHVGFFGLYMRSLFGRSLVTSFEPDPGNASTLRRCIALNGLQDSWEVIEACAASREGTVDFVSSFHLSRVGPPADDALDRLQRGIGDAFPFLEGTPLLEPKAQRVACLDVFPFLADVDLVKIDIEGAEWEIMADERFAHIGARAIVLEYHPAYLIDADAEATVARALQRAGFTISDVKRTVDAGVVWAWRGGGPSS